MNVWLCKVATAFTDLLWGLELMTDPALAWLPPFIIGWAIWMANAPLRADEPSADFHAVLINRLRAHSTANEGKIDRI